jgi:penicillin-binding protein 1C
VRATGSDLPPPLRRFNEGVETASAETATYLDPPVQIAFPPDRSELEVEPGVGGTATIMLKAEGGALPLTWLIDGKPIDVPGHLREVTFDQAGRGFVKVSVIDAHGRADRVTVRVK